MRYFRYLALSFILLFNCSFAFPQIMLAGRDIDTYVLESMKRWNVPGMSVAVIKDGHIIFSKGYGLREIGKPELVDENTIFAVASNTKAFTGTAIALLESQHKLNLDDKVAKYIPDFALFDTIASSEATVKDMLSHRIGLGTFHGDFITWGTNFSSPELINKMRYVKPVFDFRNGYGYCNSGFVVAGEIITAVTGIPWADFIRSNFIDNLKMTRTSLSVTELGKFDNIASPHTFNYNYKMVPVPWRNVDNLAPAAGINSSAVDMTKWILMQINEGVFDGNNIVGKKVILKTHTPFSIISVPSHGTGNLTGRHFRTYGLGWGIADFKGKLFIEHSGGYDGMLSRVAFMPDEKTGVVILTNNDQNNIITSFMYQVFDSFLGTEKFNWDSLIYVNSDLYEDKNYWDDILRKSDESLQPSFSPESIEGEYMNIQAGTLKIFSEKGNLHAVISSRPEIKADLFNWQNDTLICNWNDYVMGRCLARVITSEGVVTGIKLKVSDFIDPLYYEFKRNIK